MKGKKFGLLGLIMFISPLFIFISIGEYMINLAVPLDSLGRLLVISPLMVLFFGGMLVMKYGIDKE